MSSDQTDLQSIASMFSWITRVKEAFPFYDGMFIGKLWEGEFVLWPPSLTFYPCEPSLAQSDFVFSCSIGDPSFIRVCAKSMMPYHGYVVPSSIHDKLYKALKSPIPQHVTLLPIFNQDTAVAILYLERKKLDDVSSIPSISSIDLQWDMLTYLFKRLYTPRYENVIPISP